MPTPRRFFISHNKADKVAARLLAVALVEQGMDVWFDEWDIAPGESLTGGIEQGLTEADTFVLVWSKEASKSRWVGTEIRAYLRRRVDDETLRIIPIMLDETALPTLVADYRGFSLTSETTLEGIASEMLGWPIDVEIAQRLTRRLHALTDKFVSENPDAPFPYIVCPQCGSSDLRTYGSEMAFDKYYLFISCQECDWMDGMG
jgi:hypothetical protein